LTDGDTRKHSRHEKKDGSEIESQPNGGRRGNAVVGEEHKLLGRGIEAQTRNLRLS